MNKLVLKLFKKIMPRLPIQLAVLILYVYRYSTLWRNTLYKQEVDFQRNLFRTIKLRGEALTAIDVGAANGVTNSNIYPIRGRLKNGYLLLVEANGDAVRYLHHVYRGEHTKIFNGHININNVATLLKQYSTPELIDVLSIDIDSFDYDVLNGLLNYTRPRLVITEINERFPPDIYFRITQSAMPKSIGGGFYGMSLAAAQELFQRHGYKIINLFYNNVYAVPLDDKYVNACPTLHELYSGYIDKVNRKQFFYWNEQYESVVGMGVHDAINFFVKEFESLNIRPCEYIIRPVDEILV